jgi:peroxiredoxin Q/BCP
MAVKKKTSKKTSKKKAKTEKTKGARGAGSYPAVGTMAPDFSLDSTTGRPIRLSDYQNKKIVVLYFYPKDSTSGCTREACGFRDVMKASRSKRVEVLGVSCDSLASHERFKAKYALPFPLLADTAHDVAAQYGVWQQKSMAGRKYMGVVRTTFVIDKAGKLAKVYEKVKVDGHHDEVFDWIDANL